MAISKQAKLEIMKKNIFKNNTKALVQGIIISVGNLIISDKKLQLCLSSENEELINFLKDKLVELFGELKFNVAKVNRNFKNKERFDLTIDGLNNDIILKELGIIKSTENGFEFSELGDKGFMKNENTMLAFFTGMFLGSGSLSVPSLDNEEKKSYGYHFDISVSLKTQADILAEILSNFDIFPKTVERNDMFIVYLKNSDTICDVLGLMGASKIVLDLQNQRVTRDVKNLANRQSNCIAANIDKTVEAALKQLQAIEVIQSTIGIENLPDVLAEAALSRLTNPEGSLSDLLKTLSVNITKGALAQRFNKIIKIAEDLGDMDEK